MDAHRVQVDEGPPAGHVPPAGAQQRQHGPGDAQGVELLLAPVLVRDGAVQADEHIDAAQMQRQIAPVPLAGQGHAQQQGGFVGQQGCRHAHEDVPSGAGPSPAVPHRHAEDEQRRHRQLHEMHRAEQRVALVPGAELGRCDVVGFPEIAHPLHRLLAL